MKFNADLGTHVVELMAEPNRVTDDIGGISDDRRYSSHEYRSAVVKLSVPPLYLYS